jgi:hypothetical protein
MDETISYKMCAVKVLNAKLRNYLNKTSTSSSFKDDSFYVGVWAYKMGDNFCQTFTYSALPGKRQHVFWRSI